MNKKEYRKKVTDILWNTDSRLTISPNRKYSPLLPGNTLKQKYEFYKIASEIAMLFQNVLLKMERKIYFMDVSRKNSKIDTDELYKLREIYKYKSQKVYEFSLNCLEDEAWGWVSSSWMDSMIENNIRGYTKILFYLPEHHMIATVKPSMSVIFHGEKLDVLYENAKMILEENNIDFKIYGGKHEKN